MQKFFLQYGYLYWLNADILLILLVLQTYSCQYMVNMVVDWPSVNLTASTTNHTLEEPNPIDRE